MNRIKELRDAKGVPQKVLAIDLGVTQATISNWEAGAKVPSVVSTKKIADYFGVSMDYLLGYSADDSAPSVPLTEYKPVFEITDDEKNLIRLYRQLNSVGREKLLDNADDMVRSRKYIYSKVRVSGTTGKTTEEPERTEEQEMTEETASETAVCPTQDGTE